MHFYTSASYITMEEDFTIMRKGVEVSPYQRLNQEQLDLIHQTSMEILNHTGILVYGEEPANLLSSGGADVGNADQHGGRKVRIPEKMVRKSVESAPDEVKLGARNPDNALILSSKTPQVHYGSGSETNFFLETRLNRYVPVEKNGEEYVFPTYKSRRGTVEDLCRVAHLADQLENLDFFIRPINIQDEDITEENKDVNKFFASLDNINKHVMAGITDLNQVENVIKLARLVAGGQQELVNNPVISFISCVTKSPLQMVGDAALRMLAANRNQLPVVISSSPQGGSTAPIDEMGMVSMINAEILAGIVLSQQAVEGAPVIYGSVPVRARMDNLHDMYGAPEFNRYNAYCVQMSRYYGVPCYSTGGVSDARVPGIQATMEKTLSHLYIAQSGPALLHYAFGLLMETQTFCPEQAVLDNAHIGIIKKILEEPEFSVDKKDEVIKTIQEVMDSPYRIFARHARKQMRSGKMFMGYPFEGGEEKDDTMLKVKDETDRLFSQSRRPIPKETREKIFIEVPGLLSRLK